MKKHEICEECLKNLYINSQHLVETINSIDRNKNLGFTNHVKLLVTILETNGLIEEYFINKQEKINIDEEDILTEKLVKKINKKIEESYY